MFSAIILAGGSGQRLGLGYNKVLYKIKNKTILEYAVSPFLEDDDVTEVIVVMNRDDFDMGKALFSQTSVTVVKGGLTRQESVKCGLDVVKQNQYVLIHDGARPLVHLDALARLKKQVMHGPATLFTPVKDSVVHFDKKELNEYLDRSHIGLIKTPQAFLIEDLKKGYASAIKQNHHFTDDASLVMKELNKRIHLVEDSELNIKLTTESDLRILEALL